MKSARLVTWLCLSALCATAQEGAGAAASQPGENEAARSTLEIQPGKPTIKTPEILGNTKPFGPITRLPKYILQDQKAIWTSPFHTRAENAKWWLIFGGATAGLIAADKHIMDNVPRSSDTLAAGKWGSRIGAAYTLLPLSAGFYFLGSGTENERFRETGILGFEALANTIIVETVLKAATQRERPLEGDGSGRFGKGSGRLWNNDASFPSGHAINSWALATIFAKEYSNHRIVPFVAYGLASTVVISRLAAHKHFPSDVVAGSAMGYFIGDYVYGKRHNRTLDVKQSTMSKVLDHVRFSFVVAP